jgi:hypothetical protein
VLSLEIEFVFGRNYNEEAWIDLEEHPNIRGKQGDTLSPER